MGLLSNFNKVTGTQSVSTFGSTRGSRLPSVSPSQPKPSYVFPSRIAPVSFLDELTQSGAGILGEAMALPGRVVEAPFSFINTVIKGLTGDFFGGHGVDVAEQVGRTPLGAAFRSVGSVVDQVSNFVPGVLNAGDADLIHKYRGKSDDFVIPDFGEITEGGILGAIPGIGGLFGRQKTLGELKDELRARGFTDSDFANLQAGRVSKWDFGSKMTNDNLLVGLATRVIADPTNLLFLAGPLGVEAKMASLGTRVGGAIRGLATTAKRGDATFDLLTKVGTHPSPVPTALNLAKEARHGRPTGVLVGARQLADDAVRDFNRRGYDFRGLGSLSGLMKAAESTGKFFFDPKGYATRTGFYKRAAALYGTELLVTALPDGILDGLQDFAQKSLDRRPLSDNSAFMLASAFTVPFKEMVQEMPAYWTASMTKTFDNTIAPEFPKVFDGRSMEQVAREIGGRGVLEKQIMASAINLMRKRGTDLSPALKAAIHSFQERGDTSTTIGRNLYVLVKSQMETGKISGRDIMNQMIEDWKNPSAMRGEELVLPTGQKVQLDDLVTQLPFNPDNWIQRTREYAKALKVIEDGTKGNPFGLRDKVTIGTRTSYTKEQMDGIIATARGLDDGGTIPLSEIRSFLSANRVLFRMEGRESLAQFLGDYPRDRIPTDDFVKILEKSRDNPLTPTNEDYYWKDSDYQREAIFQQPDGPMQNKLESLSVKLLATMDENGNVIPRYRARHDAYRNKLHREVAWRIRRGDEDGVASPRQVAKAMRAELARFEAAYGHDVYTANTPAGQHVRDLQQSIKFFDNRAKGSSGAKSHPDFVKELDDASDEIFRIPRLEDAIVKHIPDWYQEEMRRLTDEVWQLGNEYTVTLAPKDSYIARPGDSLPEAMWKQRNLMGRVLFDHNVFGAPARVMDFLLRPVNSSQMLADAEQAIMNEYIGAGAKPKEVRAFLTMLREEAVEKHNLSPKFGYRLYGSVKAVLPHDVNMLAAKVWGGPENPVQIRIGPENHHRVIDRAGSRMLRDLKERNVRRGRPAKLSELVNDKFWSTAEDVVYTLRSGGVKKSGKSIPVLTPTLGGTRLIGNTLYHLFRFMMDPRWWLMNRFEHTIIGSVRDGLGSKTDGLQSPAFRRASGMNESLVSDPGEIIANAGNTRGRPSYLVDAAETGMFHGNRAVAARIAKTFDAERPGTVLKVLDEMDQTDPALVKLRRDFGGVDNRRLSEILDEQWFNFDRQGVGKTVQQEYSALFDNEPKTAQTMAEQALIVQRVTEANKQLYNDLVKVYLGNPDRNTLERVLNSYWLFWPISYQLKASKWLVRAMTMQAFGTNSNALGLYQYGQLREYFTDQLTNNPEFALQFDGQEHLWQTAAMFFPITPEDVGVSLSRPVRTFGSMFFPTWFEPTFGSRDPIAGLAYTFEVGPLYTARVLRSLSATIFPEGADLSIIEPQIPDLDMEQFSAMFPTNNTVTSVP